MIINKKYTFPRHFPVKITQSETLTKFFYDFCKRNWKGLNRIDIFGKSIAINQIKKGILMTSL